MSDIVYVGNKVTDVEASPLFNTYSRVTIHVDDKTTVSVGDDTGRELEFSNPFGTEAMARSILQRLSGYQYQPHVSTGALLNPAAEIGDAVNISSIYAGIFNRSKQFGRLMKADISAPCDEEINHEYQFETPLDRKFTREVGEVKASLILTNNTISATVSRVSTMEKQVAELNLTASEINAKVSQTGGNNASFGWSLLATEFGLYSNSKKVFYVNSSGAHVNGEITATSGTIGGFTIGASALQYNGMTWSDTTKTSGIYIGTSGIKLGQNFKVSNSGNITANNMTLEGTLKVGGKNITAADLRVGAQQSASNYQSWTSASNSVSSNGVTWSTGAGYGYNYNRATQANTGSYPAQFTCGRLIATYFSLNGSDVGAREITYKDGNGNTRTATFLTVQ